MTSEEFDKTGFGGKMKCEYKGKIYDIYSVDFEERLIAICETNDEIDENNSLDWKRCENVTIIK
jgi:hypothetical protein